MINDKEIDKKKDDPFALNSKNIKMDLLHFKDDILKDIKSMQKNIADKFTISNNLLKEKLESYDTKINLYNEKIIQLSNLITEDNNLKEKVDKLLSTKINFQDKLLTHEIKINNIEKDYINKINQINNILSETVIYPNVIGGISKFKTFHDLIDYILAQIVQINTYKEKNILDLSSYKKKLENLIQNLQLQLDNIIKSANEFTTKSVNTCEENFKNILSLYDERFQNVRIENQSYTVSLEKFYKDLKEELKKFNNIKNSIYNKINTEVGNMKKDNFQVVKIFGNYKKEFNLIKDRFTKLSEFIKDVRFRKNLGDYKRREYMNMGSQIDFTKKQNLDISSSVKKYILGEINAQELAFPKKFSKTNVIFNEENDYNKSNDYLINSYLNKNINFGTNFSNNVNNSSNSSPFKNTLENINIPKRKSVYNLMTPFSLKDYKINKDNNIKYSNKDIISNTKLSINDFKRVQSTDLKSRKRYTSFMDNNNNLINHLKNNLEDSKLNNETSKYNNQGQIIKEENETNSNITQSSNLNSSDKNNNSQESNKLNIENKKKEEKINNNEDKNNNINNENQKIVINKVSPISNNNFFEKENIREKGNIKEKDNKISDKIDNNLKFNNNLNNSDKKNNINEISSSQQNNNKRNINIELNQKKNEIIKDKDKINITDIKLIKIKNTEDIIENKTNNIKKVLSQGNLNNHNINKNKIALSEIFLKEDKEENFQKTINNISMKKIINNNNKIFEEFPNIDERKSFKGKKYQNFNNSLVMKLKEKILPYNSKTKLNSGYKNINKNITKIKNNNYNNTNMISFNLDEENKLNKLCVNEVQSEKNKEAKNIQKMVNNLRSYIIDYNNNLESINSARNTFYKNGKNNIIREINNSFNSQIIENNTSNSQNAKNNKANLKFK